MSTKRSFRHILFSAFVTLFVFSIAIYGSCTKDACKGVTCLNSGTCGGGSCTCKSGIGGLNCETIYRKQYANTYKGSVTLTAAGVDTTFVTRSELNNNIVFNAGTDTTDFNNMQLVWNRPGYASIAFPVVLTNNTRSGSDFTVTSTTNPVDSFTYTGSGFVNGVSASLTLTEFHPHSAPTVITFNNFTK